MQRHDWKFSQRSISKLTGVHPELVLVASRALSYSPYDFGITDGVRTLAQQEKLVADGKSKTMNSRHLTGDAIDFAVYIDGAITWDADYYGAVAGAFKVAARELAVDIDWGGDFKSFFDGPHIQRAW